MACRRGEANLESFELIHSPSQCSALDHLATESPIMCQSLLQKPIVIYVGDTLARKTDWPNAFGQWFVEGQCIRPMIRRMHSVNVSRSDTLAEICQRCLWMEHWPKVESHYSPKVPHLKVPSSLTHTSKVLSTLSKGGAHVQRKKHIFKG